MPYPGGKGSSYQKLINLMPPHSTYIETHLGGGAVMQNKRPAAINYGIDLDGEALASTKKAVLANTTGNDAAAAQGQPVFTFLRADALTWLSDYSFTGGELVYCDPPYLMGARKQERRLYRYEYTDRQHQELLDCLRGLPCKVMISGYGSPLYDRLLQGWNLFRFQAQTRGGVPATEYVWMNYPQPVELHDYGHLGADFRERERIKRKKNRWVNRLNKMPILERQALLAAIQECDCPVP